MPNAFSAVVHYLACLSVCLPTTWQNHYGEKTHTNACISPPCFSIIGRLYIHSVTPWHGPLQCTNIKCHVVRSVFSRVKGNSDCMSPFILPEPRSPLRPILILFLYPLFYLFLSSHVPSSPLCSPLLFFPNPFSPFLYPWFPPSPSSFICIQSIFSPAWWLLDEASFWLDTVMKTEILFPGWLLWVFSTIQGCSRVIDAVVVVLVSQFALIDVSAHL